MALTKEEQDRIRKRWESRQSGSTATAPVSTGSIAESSGAGTGTSLLSDSDKERINARWNQRFDIDETFVNDFLSDANKFLTQAQTDYNKLDWNSATSESSLNYYKAMQQTENDLSNRAIKIQNYLNVNKGKIDSETYNNLSSYLKNFTTPQFSKLFLDARNYYSQWETEEDYKKYDMGWLNPDAETNEDTTSKRKANYQKNADRIEEIKKALPWNAIYFSENAGINLFLTDEQKALKKELEALEAENLQYKRTQGVLDEYYVPITGEFTQNAAYRNYQNATREELQAYDTSLNAANIALANGGYYDDAGNVCDKDGNIVQPATAPEVEDKLGLFLSATDQDIAEAWDQLAYSQGRIGFHWENIMAEGDNGGWKELSDYEINIYYDLYRREGQTAAYKFLSDMKTELNRRQTQKDTERIKNAPAWQQVALNLGSIPMSVFGGVMALAEDAANVIQGKDINPYSSAHALQNTASTVREKTAEDINKLTGNLSLPYVGTTFGDVYQSVMSFADSALASVIPGGHVLLGMNAASAEMKDLYERGGSTGQILAGGILSGAAEMFFEKYSIGELKKLKNMDEKAVKNLADGFVRTVIMGGVEASEEMATEIANTISDALVMGTQSDWVDMETFVKNVANAGIGGFISGGLGGSIAAKINNSQYEKTNEAIGKKAMAMENFEADFQGVLAQALQLPKNSEAYHLAVAAQKKIAKGTQLSEAEVGALYRETAMEVVKGENAGDQANADVVETQPEDTQIAENVPQNQGFVTQQPGLVTQQPGLVTQQAVVADDALNQEKKIYPTLSDARKAAEAMLTEVQESRELGITTQYDMMQEQIARGGIAAGQDAFGRKFWIQSKSNGVYVAIVEGKGSGFVANELNKECPTYDEAYISIHEYLFEQDPDLYNVSSRVEDYERAQKTVGQGNWTTKIEGGNQNGETTGNQPIGAANIAAGQRNTGRAAVSDGEQRGPAGTGAHEQAAPMAGTAGQSQRADGRRAAFERENRNQAVRNSVRDAIPVSPRELGIPGGSADTTMKIVPIAYQTEEMKNVSDWFEERGVRAYFFVGSMNIQQGGKDFIVNGVLNGDYVFIKADSPNFDLEQIAEHEKFHLIKRGNPGLVEQLMHELQEQYTADAFAQIVDKYIKAYGSIVDMSSDGAELRIWNEILADAYAGMNARGVDVAAYQDEVVQRVQKYTGEGRQAQSNGVRQTNGPNSQAVENEGAEFSVISIAGKEGDYGIGVYLDTNLFDGVKPHDWGPVLSKFVYENLAGSELTVYDQNGNPEVIRFARKNDRVKKDGAKNSHRVIDKLARYQGDNIKALATVHLSELLATTVNEQRNAEHSHQWLDENGWIYRTAYLMDRSGNIYEAVLNIADGRNGKVLYTINNIRRIDAGVVPSNLSERGSLRNTNSPGSSIRNPDEIVNSENLDAEFALGSEPVDAGMDFEERMRRYENVPEYRPGMESSAAAEDPDVDRLLEWDRVTNDGSAKADYGRNVPKSEFEGTPHLRELGIQIENSVGDYWGTAAAVANDKAAKQMKRQIKRAETQLNATEAEKDFAAGIASGKYYVEDIPGRLDEYVVRELAEYYAAEEALDTDLLREKKASISSGLFETMKELFRDSDAFTPSAALVQNYRTPERNMLKIFGAQRGKEINDAIFSAVAVNEAERYRFMNRMFDEVRTFEDSKGKKRELTKQEHAMVMMHIEGKAASEIAAGMEMSGPINHAAENIAKGKDSSDEAREWGLGREERRLAEQVAVWIEVKEAMDSGKVDAKVVDEAAQKYSEMFNKFYDAINDFLVAHGYETIGFVRGYAPHIQPEQVRTTMNKAFHKMGIDADVGNLPASIAGMTADFKPNKRWNPHMQHRRTIKTQYDIAKAYESYVEYMSDIMYHTDDIMRVRQAANYFRRTYAPEEIKNMLEWAEELRKEKRPEQKAAFLRANGKLGNASSMSVKDIDEQFNEFVEEQYRQIENAGKYSELVKYLDNYANILAGKQSYRDRGSEANGRALMAAGNKLVQMFARSQVAGSISSALNQTAQLPQIIAEVGDVNVAHALWDMVTGKLRRAAWAQESDFLTGKKGVDFLVTEGGEKMISALFTPASFVDGTISTLAVRGEYLKQIKAGKSHAEAMKLADKKGTAIMGSRMKGSKPVAFHAKNFFDSIINVFQIEALNSWEHLSQDLPRDFHEIAETKGKRAAAGALANVLVKMILAAFIINRLDDELYGGTPAPFDVLGLTANFIASGEGLTTNQYLCTVFDNAWEKMTGDRPFDTDASELGEDFNWKNAVEDTVYNISNEIPFVRNISALMGAGDDTLPLPDVAGSVKDAYDAILDGKTEKLPEVAFGALTDFIPGGRQLEKTAQGLDVFLRGGKYSGYGDDAKLQYKVEQNAVNFIKAILFGRSGLGQSEFYASGGKSLTDAQTQAIEKLEAAGYDGMQIYDMMLKFRDLEPKEGEQKVTELQKCMEVAWSAWPEDMKAAVLETMMSESAYQMYKSAHDAGVTTYEYFELMGSIDELEPEDGNKEVSNLQKYMEVAMTPWPEQMKTATLEGMMPESSYQKYKEALDAGVTTYWYFKFLDDIQDLQSDKDKNGNTVNGSLKKKVVAVIDGMKLSPKQKDALFLTKYAESGLDEVPWN